MSITDNSFVSPHEKWDHCIENMVRKSTLGLAIGVLPALVFARTAIARFGLVFFSVGIGSGIAYREARYLFDHDVVFDNRYLVQLQSPPIIEENAAWE